VVTTEIAYTAGTLTHDVRSQTEPARPFCTAADLYDQVRGMTETPTQTPSPAPPPLGTAEDLIQIQTLTAIRHPKVREPCLDKNIQNVPLSFQGPILPATEAPYHGLPRASSSDPGGGGWGLGGAAIPTKPMV